MRRPLCLLACLAALAAAGPAAAAAPPATHAWAVAAARSHLAVDLHDYFGLTLRFVSAGTTAACTRNGDGFRCTARLRADEGPKFTGSVRASFLLRRAADGEPVATRVRVLSCHGLVCPVH